jgi:hypothetical protein
VSTRVGPFPLIFPYNLVKKEAKLQDKISSKNKTYIYNMVITLHYIDDEWEMRSVIIGFKRIMYPHTGERLADNS